MPYSRFMLRLAQQWVTRSQRTCQLCASCILTLRILSPLACTKRNTFLLMTLDGIDFTFCSATVDRTEPENLIHEFMTLTRLKIDCIRYDSVSEFAKSAAFRPSVTTIISRWRQLPHILTQSSHGRSCAHRERAHAMLTAPRQAPMPFLVIQHAELLSRVCLLDGSAWQKRV